MLTSRPFLSSALFICFWSLILCTSLLALRQDYGRSVDKSLFSSWTTHSTEKVIPPPVAEVHINPKPAPAPAPFEGPLTPGQQCPPIDPKRPCRSLPGAEDVLIVIRTGATEIDERLPPHLATLLQCAPNVQIFSDSNETFCGHTVRDVFQGTRDELKNHHTVFEYYRDLRLHGKQHALDKIHNSTSAEQDAQNDVEQAGKLKNPAWKIDKYKFLPMARDTLTLRPEYKWYVFIELDTFLYWSSLLRFLAQFDASKPYYLGAPMTIGPDLFAYGGSGFALSRPALERLSKEYTTKQQWWEERTTSHWAGDCILGMALRAAGVELTKTLPPFWTRSPQVQEWSLPIFNKQPWCIPPVSFHHVTSGDILCMWTQEQAVQERGKQVRPADVFDLFLAKELVEERKGWDNLITWPFADPLAVWEEDEKEKGMNAALCRAKCADDAGCKQWHFARKRVRDDKRLVSQCTLEKGIMLGAKAVGVGSDEESTAGWMLDRIDAFRQATNVTCKDF